MDGAKMREWLMYFALWRVVDCNSSGLSKREGIRVPSKRSLSIHSNPFACPFSLLISVNRRQMNPISKHSQFTIFDAKNTARRSTNTHLHSSLFSLVKRFQIPSIATHLNSTLILSSFHLVSNAACSKRWRSNLIGGARFSFLARAVIPSSNALKASQMSWKNPIDVFWTSSVEPRIFMLYFLVQLGQGLPWTALSLMLTRDIVSVS